MKNQTITQPKLTFICKFKGWFTVLLFFSAIYLFAQSPQTFKYQSVVRDADGEIISGQLVSLRTSILQNNPSGTIVYSETHNPTTNAFGLINLVIGTGSIVSGNFTSIDWGGDEHFLRIELDDEGGTNYQLMGTSQLLSVPYSLHSSISEEIVLPYHGETSTSETVFNIYNNSIGNGIRGINLNSMNFGILGNSNYGVYGENNNGNLGYLGGNNYGTYGYGVYGIVGEYNVINGPWGYIGGAQYALYGEGWVGNTQGYVGGNDIAIFGEHTLGNYGYLGGEHYGVYGSSSSGHAGYFEGDGYFSGSLGIGTTMPGYPLEVNGVVYAYEGSLQGGLCNNNSGAFGFHSDGYYGYLGKNNGAVYGEYSGPVGAWTYGKIADPGVGVMGYNSEEGTSGSLATYSYGVRGDHIDNFGYIGSYDYGIYGENGIGNFGYVGSYFHGVYGEHAIGNYGYLGGEQYGVYGNSVSGHAGYFEGDGYFSGNLGIGTDSPTEKLEVYGLIKSSFGYVFPDGSVQTSAGKLSFPYADTANVIYEPALLIVNEGSASVIMGKLQFSGNYGQLGATDIMSPDAYGVLGHAESGMAVMGRFTDTGPFGYLGGSNTGVYGENETGYCKGYLGSNSAAVRGEYWHMGIMNFAYGELGNGGSGVYGSNSEGTGTSGYIAGYDIGVMGTSSNVSGYLGDMHHDNLYGYGVYGECQSGSYGYIGNFIHGVYGKNATGNYGFLGGTDYGVYGNSSSGYAGYFEGKGYFSDNVGIGTTSPGYPLEVNGTIYAHDGSIHGIISGSNYGIYGEYNNGNNGYLGGTNYGVYGEHNNGNNGYLGGTNYGIYGYGEYGVFGEHNTINGPWGYLAGDQHGVYGEGWMGNSGGYIGGLLHGIYGFSSTGHAGYFEGKGYFSGRVGINETNPQATLHVNDVMLLEPRGSAPTSPSEGMIYYDNSSKKLRVYDGSIWQDCF